MSEIMEFTRMHNTMLMVSYGASVLWISKEIFGGDTKVDKFFRRLGFVVGWFHLSLPFFDFLSMLFFGKSLIN